MALEKNQSLIPSIKLDITQKNQQIKFNNM